MTVCVTPDGNGYDVVKWTEGNMGEYATTTVGLHSMNYWIQGYDADSNVNLIFGTNELAIKAYFRDKAIPYSRVTPIVALKSESDSHLPFPSTLTKNEYVVDVRGPSGIVYEEKRNGTEVILKIFAVEGWKYNHAFVYGPAYCQGSDNEIAFHIDETHGAYVQLYFTELRSDEQVDNTVQRQYVSVQDHLSDFETLKKFSMLSSATAGLLAVAIAK